MVLHVEAGSPGGQGPVCNDGVTSVLAKASPLVRDTQGHLRQG